MDFVCETVEMKDCEKCIAGREAMDALRAAHDYEQRRFNDDGFVSYNPDEAIRLAREAVRASDAAPVGHYHSVWYKSEEDDFAMMEVDPGAFYQIKEHVSDRPSEESIFKSMPLELWADHIEWWK